MSARANTEVAENASHEAREAGGLGEKLSAVWQRVADFVDEYKFPAATATASAVFASVGFAQACSTPFIAVGSWALSAGLASLSLNSAIDKDSVKKAVTSLAVSFACFTGTGAVLWDDALAMRQAGSDREQAAVLCVPPAQQAEVPAPAVQ